MHILSSSLEWIREGFSRSASWNRRTTSFLALLLVALVLARVVIAGNSDGDYSGSILVGVLICGALARSFIGRYLG